MRMETKGPAIENSKYPKPTFSMPINLHFYVGLDTWVKILLGGFL